MAQGACLSHFLASSCKANTDGQCVPCISTIRAEVQTLVGLNHGILDPLLLGPNQHKHAPDPHHGVAHAKLEASDKEIDGFQDIRDVLGAQKLRDDGHSSLDFTYKVHGVLKVM